ncbi:hypothetical protein STCU_06107 [Strigomonas culicis]|uniref:Uncharacterized protein n=1 Tax=Strigomonas culicis TaxID=28005 RepID=S9UCT2_9TRYP|nr:hypothetical protein STCU_06107 [Strigomonas culicis]|eukprot:EPY26733.1 hypothetical protein STCU_06107 [Strigomonas culicis]
MKRTVKNNMRGSRQSFKNKVKYDPNKYKLEKEQLPAHVVETMTSLCCPRCCQILRWKVDYGKFVPQQRSRKCNLCGEVKVALAYHRICQGCARAHGRCAKCQKVPTRGARETDDRLLGDEGDEEDEEDEEVEEVPRAAAPLAPPAAEDGAAPSPPPGLQFLDTTYIDKMEARKRKEEEMAQISCLREREKRTVLRQKRAQAGAGEASDNDSDVTL